MEAPLPTVSSGGIHAGLVSAFLAKHYGGVVGQPLDVPAPTVTAVDHTALVATSLIQTGYGERPGQAPRVPGLEKPLGTAVDGQKHALVAAFLAKHYTGVVGSDLPEPIGTVTSVDHHSLVAAR